MGKSHKTSSSDRARRRMEKTRRRSARLHRAAVAKRRSVVGLDLPRGEWIVNLTEWEAQFDKGMADLEAGRFHEAERTFAKLLDNSPPATPLRGQAAFGLGTAYAKLGDQEKAYALLKQAAQLDGSRHEHWHNLAMVCIHRQRPYEAERAWRECLRRDPGEDVARMARSALQLIDEQTQSRLAANPELTHEALERQERVFDEGVQALDRDDAAGAAERFRQSAAIDPMHHQSWGNLGAALLNMGQLDEGERALRRSLELDPDYAFARFNLEALRRLREGGATAGRTGLSETTVPASMRSSR